MTRSLLISFTMAALCFLPIWSTSIDSYFYYDYPSKIYDHIFYLLILFWLLSLTAVIALIMRYSSNRFIFPLACFAAAATAAITLNTVRLELGLTGKVSMNVLLAFCLICVCLTAYFYVKCGQVFLRILRNCILIMSPFAFLMTGTMVWRIFERVESPSEHSKSISPMRTPVNGGNKSTPRILWMIFDELDIRFAFEHRDGLPLPHLDKLKNSSMYATNAYSAESDTLHSIPAMFSGLNLIKPVILGNQDLKFTINETQKSVTWKEIPSIFDKAKKMNLKTAILGNYHPYHKIFGNVVNYCLPSCIPEVSIWKKMTRYSRLILNTIFFDGIPLMRRSKLFSDDIKREIFIDVYQHMLDKAIPIISDPDYNLIFIHWTIPHAPGIYESSGKKFNPSYQANYFDNLVLVDETIGKIWDVSKDQGIWDSTIVIVTSDHWLRKIMLEADICTSLNAEIKDMICHPDYRVPLMIKMPHQQEQVLYTGPFRMYHIHDMLENMLKGNIRTSADLTGWMQLQEARFTTEGLF